LTFIFTYSDLTKSGSETIPQFKKQLDDPCSSSNGVSFDNSSWSDTWLPSNDDLLYASLLFDEQVPWSDSDNENVQEQSEEINRVNNDNQSLHDILVELNSNINPTQISKFNICRSHLWEGACKRS
jgi:dynactin complex subunit